MLFILFIIMMISFVHSEDNQIISVLATSSRKGGLMHFAGFMGSLLQNPAAHRLDVYLLVDELHRTILSNCNHLNTSSFHNMIIINLEELDNTVEGMRLRNETGDTRRFDSAIYKLDLVKILPTYPDSVIHRMIVLDIDVLVLEDLGNLWQEYDINPGKFIYMAAEGYNDDGYYTKTSTKKHYPPPYGLSSGVMIANLDEWRKHNLTGDAFVTINDEDTYYPDQDIFNTWAYYNQQKYGELACRWNRRLGSTCWDNDVLTNHTRSDRGIMHGNKGVFHPSVDFSSQEYELEKKSHREFSHVFFSYCHSHMT